MMTGEVKDFLYRQGVDLVGIAAIDEIPSYHPPRVVEDVLPGARSVVVIGRRMLRGSIESPSPRVSTAHSNSHYRQLERDCYEAGCFLERMNYQAATLPLMLPIEMSRERKGMSGDLSLKHLAVAAGLGKIGRSGLLLTKEFGSRVRLAAIVTTAELVPDHEMTDESPCEDCCACVKACPVQAIHDSGKVDVFKCLTHVQPYGLANFNIWLAKQMENPQGAQAALGDPNWWNYYQALALGMYYNCFRCINACPAWDGPGSC
ncbi:epoxyqueuosine reductase [Dethiobacter alkaliphilus]|uniref:4Fe-4S ferredoxin iron-sulfur binding domain protein n=1 Tax=Dethiobacter alkaliphilus AHT 1 TaxID=555088 RepID=C0GJP6_DETAL|nr:epoxyqueuosine reductase [Dethiobacter alkaliphilus]EEG76468.1 4Fe-4S ferredoxin iron-sulfur binding domain protein [Dethiobacter alkaliphilus AHT 1]